MDNSKTWSELYDHTSFGNKYPLSYLVSLFHTRVKPEIQKRKPLEDGNVLDFACSLGANSKVYQDLGMNVYGIDISKTAIAKAIWGGIGDDNHFKAANLLEPELKVGDLFLGVKFDFVIASECLYYFKNDERRELISKLSDAMSEEGIFYANMPTYDFSIYQAYKEVPKDADGMIEVRESGRISSSLMVNLPRNKDEMVSMFEPLKAIDIMTTDNRLYSDVPMVEYHILAKK